MSINDMTVGNPFKVLWKFSIPMLLSMMLQQCYNIVDSVIAGNFIGVDALAAVGASYPITALFIAIATGASVGCSVVISIIFGSKDLVKMKSAISTSIITLTSLSVILVVVGLAICNPLMHAMKTPDNIFNDSALYLRVYIFGVIFLFVYNTSTAIFNALGKSKVPLYFLICSSVLNVILDLIFVIVFKMGVSGLAWATYISQAISSILAMLYLIKRLKSIKVSEKYKLFDKLLLISISKIAVPSILQQSFVSVGQLFVQSLINSYGSIVVAGYSAAFKINTFAIMTITTMSQALSNFTAQNIGAKKLDRVKSGYKSAMTMTFIYVVGVILVFLIFSDKLIGLFVEKNSGQEVIKVGLQFLRTVSPFYLIVTAKIVTDGVLRGAGAMKLFLITTFADLVLRVALSYILSWILQSYIGIWWSYPIGWIMGCILSLYFYIKGTWKKNMQF